MRRHRGELTAEQREDLYGQDPRMCSYCRHYDHGLCKFMPAYVERLATDECGQWEETLARAGRRAKAELARLALNSIWFRSALGRRGDEEAPDA